jgi:hypothetical protein
MSLDLFCFCIANILITYCKRLSSWHLQRCDFQETQKLYHLCPQGNVDASYWTSLSLITSMFWILHGWVPWCLTWLDMAWHGLTRKEQQLLQLWSSGRGPEDACCTWQLILWNSDVVERNEFSFFLIFLCFLANKFKLCRLQCAQPLVEVVDPDEEWNQRLRGTGAAGRLAT